MAGDRVAREAGVDPASIPVGFCQPVGRERLAKPPLPIIDASGQRLTYLKVTVHRALGYGERGQGVQDATRSPTP